MTQNNRLGYVNTLHYRNKLTIIRGLPGSGKSTYGRQLANQTGAIFIEPDMFCMHRGEYHYTAQLYEDATKRALHLLHVAQCDCIYADVLPTQNDVMRVYNSFFFGNYGCGSWDELRIVTLKITVEESLAKNIHHVAECDIRRMASSWEPVLKEEVMRVSECLLYEEI